MHRRLSKILYSLGTCCFLFGCAGLNQVPNGSRTVGIYSGTFDDDPRMTIWIKLYETPEGDSILDGTVIADIPDSQPMRYNLVGSEFQNEFQYELKPSSGILTGRLSADGSTLTGDYRFARTGRTGTWQAMKQ